MGHSRFHRAWKYSVSSGRESIVPSGRMGGVTVMKVPVDAIEQFDQYSYYVGDDADGMPQWIQGEAGVAQAKTVIEGPVGEIFVLYDAHLGTFLLIYIRQFKCIQIIHA